MTTATRVSAVFAAACELGAKVAPSLPISTLPGCCEHSWEHAGAQWHLAVNGHKEPIRVEPADAMGWDVEPCEYALWKNGWLAASGYSGGGVRMIDEGELLEALEAAVALAPESRR